MKPKSVTALIALGSLILGLTGCTSTPKLNVEFDKATDFTKAKTFLIRPIPNNIPGVDPGVVLRVGPAATAAARSALTAKGYIEVFEAGKADIAVLLHGKAVPKTDVTDWGYTGGGGMYGRYPYYGMYGGSNVSVDQYEEGTLIVEVYDVKTKKMIWVGWGVSRMTSKTEDQPGNVGSAVTNLLASYPVVGQIPVAPVQK